jgi:hypothetical protein
LSFFSIVFSAPFGGQSISLMTQYERLRTIATRGEDEHRVEICFRIADAGAAMAMKQ